MRGRRSDPGDRRRTCIRLLVQAAFAAAAMGPFGVSAQAIIADDHPGFALAEEIAGRGCVLHQDDVNEVMAAAGLAGPAFPQFAVPLMRDGFLISSGNGTLTLVNWGICTGAADAEAEDPGQSTETETE